MLEQFFKKILKSLKFETCNRNKKFKQFNISQCKIIFLLTKNNENTLNNIQREDKPNENKNNVSIES